MSFPCHCSAYSQPHDHEWTGDDPFADAYERNEEQNEACARHHHEYGPMVYGGLTREPYYVCDNCGHELEQDV